MQPDFSDEHLMAFADGTLDEPLFSAVADAVERDHDLAQRLELLVNGAALARSGYEPLLQPVSPQLESSVRTAIAKSRKPAWPWSLNWNWALPVSGLVAAVAIVALATPALLNARSRGPLDILSGSELTAALDTLPSGETRNLADDKSIHAIATFTDAEGRVCREFEAGGYAAIACRSDADWQVALAVAIPATDDGYRPAAGLATIDAYLDSMGASSPLLDQDEANALARAGRQP